MIWKKRCMVGLCFLLFVISLPCNVERKTTVHASDNFSVVPKVDSKFFVNEPITAEQFDITFGEGRMNKEQIFIEPEVCTQAGVQKILVSYDTESGYYRQGLSIEVQSVIPVCIEPETTEVVLVKGTEVTKEQLPVMYVTYNNGKRHLVSDYTCQMDWENGMLTVSYQGISTTLPVKVVDSTLQFIEVCSKKQCVPMDYVFQKEDMQVMAYFTDGTCMEVTAYQILPYTLSQGGETHVSVQYEGKTASFIVKTADSKDTIVENGEPDVTDSLLTPTPDSNAPAGTEVPFQNKENTENRQIFGTDFPQDTSEKSDCTKPVTNVKSKVYKKNLTITFLDKESGVQSAQLSGDWNGTIVSGYVLKKEGRYTLTVTDQAGNQTIVHFSIQKPAKRVEVSCMGTSVWKKIQFQAKVTGTKRAVAWKCSNTSIGTISQRGVFRARRSGSCYVRAAIDGITVKKKVVVHKRQKYVLVY